MKQYVIEIPDGVIPDGYEPVAFRNPMKQEECVASQGHVFSSTGGLGEPRLILRRKWQWPEWLDADVIRFEAGEWVAFVNDGTKSQASWGIRWSMTNHPEPPDKTRVYTNPRKDGGK